MPKLNPAGSANSAGVGYFSDSFPVNRSATNRTSSSRVSAQAKLMVTPRLRVWCSPKFGSNTQLVMNAPVAAPKVFAPYRPRMVGPAAKIFEVRALANIGSDTPMKNVGQSKLRKRIVQSTPPD